MSALGQERTFCGVSRLALISKTPIAVPLHARSRRGLPAMVAIAVSRSVVQYAHVGRVGVWLVIIAMIAIWVAAIYVVIWQPVSLLHLLPGR